MIQSNYHLKNKLLQPSSLKEDANDLKKYFSSDGLEYLVSTHVIFKSI